RVGGILPLIPFSRSSRNLRRPTAKYTKVGERLRHVIPGHMQCSMACGGRIIYWPWLDPQQKLLRSITLLSSFKGNEFY
uniref:Uncharacterized protein n=1 Tax=Gopherus evgoodei TaxID=1825980 RepID=A0A8C4W4F8_9SAUR